MKNGQQFQRGYISKSDWPGQGSGGDRAQQTLNVRLATSQSRDRGGGSNYDEKNEIPCAIVALDRNSGDRDSLIQQFTSLVDETFSTPTT